MEQVRADREAHSFVLSIRDHYARSSINDNDRTSVRFVFPMKLSRDVHLTERLFAVAAAAATLPWAVVVVGQIRTVTECIGSRCGSDYTIDLAKRVAAAAFCPFQSHTTLEQPNSQKKRTCKLHLVVNVHETLLDIVLFVKAPPAGSI